MNNWSSASLAMLAFAANSILCRIALNGGFIDPASFTSLRLFSGALVLAIFFFGKGDTFQISSLRPNLVPGMMLFVYAACFSFAYVDLSVGAGALILFGMVQLTMVTVGTVNGERQSVVTILGMLIALGGLVYFLLPGATTPSLSGALLMGLSGIAWGIYSLLGRRAADPVLNTARNFAVATPLALILGLFHLTELSLSLSGIALAITSGAAASAMGYIIWYRVLPELRTATASTIQLSVPVLAALIAIIFMGETVTQRFVIATITILGGIWMTIKPRPVK